MTEARSEESAFVSASLLIPVVILAYGIYWNDAGAPRLTKLSSFLYVSGGTYDGPGRTD